MHSYSTGSSVRAVDAPTGEIGQACTGAELSLEEHCIRLDLLDSVAVLGGVAKHGIILQLTVRETLGALPFPFFRFVPLIYGLTKQIPEGPKPF